MAPTAASGGAATSSRWRSVAAQHAKNNRLSNTGPAAALAAHPVFARDIAQALPKAYDFGVERIVCRVHKLNNSGGEFEARLKRLLTDEKADEKAEAEKAKKSTSQATGSKDRGMPAVRSVGLQMPDGLLAWAPGISCLLEKWCKAGEDRLSVTIFGDVNYGACCIDDLTASSLGVDLLVHFGHSPLIPTEQAAVRTMYVPVHMDIDCAHLVNTVLCNFFPVDDAEKAEHPSASENASSPNASQFFPNHHGRSRCGKKIAMLGTVQFCPSLMKAALAIEHGSEERILARARAVVGAQARDAAGQPIQQLAIPQANQQTDRRTGAEELADLRKKLETSGKEVPAPLELILPQVRPLGFAEVLGCTAPQLPDSVDEVIFVADGRFHLEAVMMRNPRVKFYRYDPYGRALTLEEFGYRDLLKLRKEAVAQVRKLLVRAHKGEQDITVGLVLGTLGRQGSVSVLERMKKQLERRGIGHFVLLCSEISPDKLRGYEDRVHAWVQVACPRLSLDWGHAFGRPLLTTFEMNQLLAIAEKRFDGEAEPEVSESASTAASTPEKNSASASSDVADESDVTKDPLWPKMDYYANEGGTWASYGGEDGAPPGANKFAHMGAGKGRKLHGSRLVMQDKPAD